MNYNSSLRQSNQTMHQIFLRTTGLYTQTLAKIILLDVTRSMEVFIVIFFSFCGALTLSLCYSGSSENQELRYVSVEYISLTKLGSCTDKNNLAIVSYNSVIYSRISFGISLIWFALCWLDFVFIQRILALLQKQFTGKHNACKALKPNILILILIFLLVVLETFCWVDFVRCSSSIQWRKITQLLSRCYYSLKILLLFARNDCVELSCKWQFKEIRY